MTKKITINKITKILTEKVKDINIVTNKSFKDLTTFKIGGKIKCLVEIKQPKSLIKVLKILKEYNFDYIILGCGSNILASDKVCKKVVLKIMIDDVNIVKNKIICGSGVNLFKLNQIAINNGLSNLEWSYGIPGSVGGAIKMNAGCFGKEMKDVVDCVYYTDGEKIYKKSNKSLKFSYRESFFTFNNFVILKVVFNMSHKPKEEIEKSCFDTYKLRRKLQPYEYQSAGSVFKRPENNFAPVLIEKCGLKGVRQGGAEISSKHCGFIVNKNQKASFRQVFLLISKIKKTVFKKFGIILKEEIIILK